MTSQRWIGVMSRVDWMMPGIVWQSSATGWRILGAGAIGFGYLIDDALDEDYLNMDMAG